MFKVRWSHIYTQKSYQYLHFLLVKYSGCRFCVKKIFCLEPWSRLKFADPDRYKYSGYGIGYDVCGFLSLSDGIGFSKNVIVFDCHYKFILII